MAVASAPAAARDAPARRAARAGHRHRLPYEWPLLGILIAFPLWWALGVGALIWPVFAVVMAARLITRREAVRVPRGFGLWCLFLLWMLGSSIGLSSEQAPVAYVWRVFIYLSCTVFFLYVYNAPRDELPAKRILQVLATFWLIVVACGWLGVVAPNGQFTSLMERLLPASMVENPFVRDLVHPSFAQVQTFLGYPVGRPKAPFVYTNDWGSVYALLCPVFFAVWLQSPRIDRRVRGFLILGVSLVPVFVSLNRGLWLSLGIALLYAGARPGDVGRAARKALFTLATLGLAVLLFTPLKSVVEDRAQTGHSNEGREYLYEETMHRVAASPLIGYGGPQQVEGNRILPSIGTQGQFWLVLISQGIVGTALFMGFLLQVTWRTRRGPPTVFWPHVVLIVGLVQLPIYDMMPAPLHIIFIAAGLALREAHGEPDSDDDAVDLRGEEVAG